MSDISKSVSNAFGGTKDYRIDYHLVESGSPALITGLYSSTSDVALDFYKKPDITSGDGTTKSVKIYGEVLITPYLVDSGVTNSTNDPSSVIKTYRFHLGSGSTAGIVPGPNGNQLENVYLINPNQTPVPVVSGTGRPSTGDVVLAATLGGLITSTPKIWDAIKSAAPANQKAPQIDPVTGKAIPSTSAINQKNASAGVLLDTLGNVNAQGKGENWVLAWDPASSTWKAVSPNQLVGLAVPGGMICGGAGGTGGTGGGGGSTGGGSSSAVGVSGPIVATGLDYLTLVNNLPVTVYYIDDSGNQVNAGTISSTDLAAVSTSSVNTAFTQLINSRISATGKFNDINTQYAGGSVYVINFGSSYSSAGINCGANTHMSIVLKNAGGTVLTTTIPSSACGVCYIKAPNLQTRNAVAASTTNIAATNSIISRSVTLPTITCDFTIHIGTRYYISNYTITSGGSGFYSPVPFVVNGSSEGTCNVSGGAITSISLNGIASQSTSGTGVTNVNGIGYDPATTTSFFYVPTQTRQLTISGGISTLDGVTINTGDIFLLKDQTDHTQNGIYQKITSTTFNLIQELCATTTIDGFWCHVATGGTVNGNKDFMLYSGNVTKTYTLTSPMAFTDVTANSACDPVPGTPGGSGGGGGSGSAGSAGSPGTCITINTTTVPSPIIVLANPCTTTYGGIDPTTSNYTPVTLPACATLTSNSSPDTVTLLYTVTLGDGVFNVLGTLPAGVTASIGYHTISLSGATSAVQTASAQIQVTPPITSKTAITWQALVTNSASMMASQVCSINPQNLVQKTNAAACSTITITAASGSDTGKLQVTPGTSSLFTSAKDLTNGYVPFNTSLSQTAADFVTNINANIAVKNALATTDANWLPLYSASNAGPVIKICAPAAGGADFNGITLNGLTTGAFAWGGSSSMLGGISANVSSLLSSIPHWDAISGVLGAVAGSVAGAVVSNIIMNKASSVQISVPEQADDVSIAFLYRGAKVQIPNEYTNATFSVASNLTRSGHPTFGTFSGTYRTDFTNNPAWIVYDFIKNQREGLGSYLPLTAAQDALLIQDIFTIAVYCDEMVAGIGGTMKNRFSTNTVITDGSRMQVLEQLCSVFLGGYSFWNGGIRLTADAPDTNVALLVNQENCGNIVENLTSVGTFVNKVMLTYVEPNNFYNNEVVVAENQAAIKEWGEKLSNVTAFGCTDSDQAIRLANWILNSQQQNADTKTYAAGLDHYNLVPGQLIQYENPLERGVRYSGRVKSVSGTAVVLDAPIDNIVGDAFAITNNDGTIFNTTIAALSGTSLTMAAASSGTIDPWATFIASDSVIGKRLYKVVKVDETSLGQYSVTIQFFSPSKFTVSTVNSIPSVPAALAVTDQAGTYIKLHWEASTQTTGPGIAGYYVYRNGNTTTPYATLGNVLTYTDTGVTASTIYTYQVAAFSSDTTALVSLPSAAIRTFTRFGKWMVSAQPGAIMQTSSDGVTWASVAMPGTPTTHSWAFPRCSPTTQVSTSQGTNQFAYSTNAGTSWTTGTMPFTGSFGYNYSVDASGGAGQFVALVTASANAVYSANGISWTSTTLPISSTFTNPIFGNGIWLAVNTVGSVAITSVDGITWTQRTLPTNLNWSTPVFANGVFLILSQNATANVALTTVDGSIFNIGTMPSIGAWAAPMFAKNQFVTVLPGSTSAATSPDGLTWTSHTMPSTASWATPVYGDGVYVSFGGGTTFAHSTDGTTWTAGTLPVSHTWNPVRFANNKFVCPASGSADFLYSADGVTWTVTTVSTSLAYVTPAYV